MSANGSRLDVPALESWLWDAACKIRGPLDAPKFKDYILPLIFLKRLSDVFDDELRHLVQEFGDEKSALRIVDGDHKLVRCYIPTAARWPEIARRTTGLGEYLTDQVRGVARENPALAGVIDTVDFNASAAGQRIIDDDRLASLIQVMGQHRLGLDDVEPDILGRAYEYLIRKFAEGQGQSAIEASERDKFALRMGDILVNRVNSLSHLAKSALVQAHQAEAVFESNMMRFRVDESRVLADFVHRYLLHPLGTRFGEWRNEL